MDKLRDKIANLIRKKIDESQYICSDPCSDRDYIEREESVFLNLADAIIPMVKTEQNKAKKPPSSPVRQ